LLKPTRGGVLAGEIGRAQALGVGPLSGKPGGHPVQLARHVVIDVAEPKALEPPRGSRRHVSSSVPTVDDDLARAVEQVRRPLLDMPQRKVESPRQVVLLVFGAGQDLDQLCAPVEQPADVVAIDLLWHRQYSFSRPSRTAQL